MHTKIGPTAMRIELPRHTSRVSRQWGGRFVALSVQKDPNKEPTTSETIITDQPLSGSVEAGPPRHRCVIEKSPPGTFCLDKWLLQKASHAPMI